MGWGLLFDACTKESSCGLEIHFALALSDKLQLASAAVDDCGWDVVANASVDDDIHLPAEELVDKLGVGEVFAFAVGVESANRCAYQRCAYGTDDGVADGVGRHADANGAIGVQVVARNVVVGIENECVWARQVASDELECVAVERTHVFRNGADVGTEHRVFGLLDRETFQSSNRLDGLFEFHTARKSVQSIGGKNDYSPIVDDIGYTIDIVIVRVVVV